MPTINERFRQLREAKGLTQEEFASGAHRTRSEIKNIEYGKTSPKEEVIFSVCSAYGVNENWLRTGEGEMLKPVSRDEELATFVGSVMHGESSDFRRRLVAVLSKLDEDEWLLLERMAKKLAEETEKGDQA